MAELLFAKILLHLDGRGRRARTALDAATALAVDAGAELHVLDVVRALPGRLFRSAEADYQRLLLEARRKVLHNLCKGLDARGVRWRAEVVTGVPAVEVIRTVLRDSPDLVVRAAEGRVVGRLFGGTDMTLLRKCPAPVLAVRPGRRRFRRVVAAIDPDMDDEARASLNPRIMRAADHMANCHGATLDIVHAWHLFGEDLLRSDEGGLEPEQYRRLVREERRHHFAALEREIAPFGFAINDPRVHVLKGRPDEVLPEVVANLEADLLVMGTVGRQGLSGLVIGNTAETVLGRVGCSVLALKPEGFRTPIQPAPPEQPRGRPRAP